MIEGFLNMEWLVALGSILLLNLLLSGDNALVIAMASRSLPIEQRRQAIFWGSAGAVVFRVALTLAATTLLGMPWVQCLGGVALLWVAVNLLGKEQETGTCKVAGSLREAVQIILFADLIMSLDNVLALAAIAQTVPESKYSLIIVGLTTSIPLVVFGAQLLLKLMDHFPVIIYAGAAMLGYAAAEMILADKALGGFMTSYAVFFKVALVVAVMGVGYWLRVSEKPHTEESMQKEKANSL
jgi:YjbE family integral membrane protein